MKSSDKAPCAERELLREAEALAGEITENRRTIHRLAEVGLETEKTAEFVEQRLREYGLEPRRCGKCGVTAVIGAGAPCILLRADMDALPMREESGLPFAADNGNCHACGHDCHPAMLLGAAKLLKAHEAALRGTVKLMFQPGEEVGLGAAEMLSDGLLESPKVDAALALHTSVLMPGSRTGVLRCIRGQYGRVVGGVTITVHGSSAHGAASWRGVDALTVASFLNLAFQSVIAREVASDEADIILTGTMQGGTTANSVAGEAVLGVTLRAPDQEKWDFLLSRVESMAEHIAAAFRAGVTVRRDHCIGAPYNDPALTARFAAWAEELLGAENVELTDRSFGAGDDFYHVTDAVPGALLNLGFGSREEGFAFGGHNPRVVYNEAALPVGAAVFAGLAMCWLAEQGGN